MFVDSFLCLDVREFTICEEENLFIIKSKQDWLDQGNQLSFEDYFDNLIHIKNQSRALQAEVFLAAFYFPFYTIGKAGEHGERVLFEKCGDTHTAQDLENYDRVLIVSKEQKLPELHGINFERPKRSVSELENEKRWLDISIKQAGWNE